jgi:hypothetical protein
MTESINETMQRLFDGMVLATQQQPRGAVWIMIILALLHLLRR